MELTLKEKNKIFVLYKNFYLSSDFYRRPCFNSKTIKGNKVLFVSQNPGCPFSRFEIERFNQMKDFGFVKYQKSFNESWANSLFGKFFFSICNLVYDGFDKQASFTNLVKYITNSNEVPEISKQDRKVFVGEIEIIRPEIVIYLSKHSFKNSSDILDCMKIKHYVFNHPAVYTYSFEYANKIASLVKKICLL